MARTQVTPCCTWDPFALDGFGDDGERLETRLTQDFTQLLHTVAIHDDSLPPATTRKCILNDIIKQV